ncbi:mite group 2 allergen Tyr p 2-like [Tetranychus urticae]|uniref:mite group 2 allergen Tyr p 2-like n=1 Tax=Tetranychus urticae TaxID=32264 RepID=UPI00077BDAB0|nr:mite group 2 allergen Tyr p 2-like [Tetranychus urticae]
MFSIEILFPVFLFSSTINLAFGQSIKYETCGNKSNDPLSVNITGCQDSTLCTINRSKPVHFSLNYVSPIDSPELRLNIWAHFFRFWIPIKNEPFRVCGQYGVECPIVKGREYLYNMTVNAPWFPQVRTKIRFMLSSPEKNPIVCAIIKIRIV